MWRKFFAGFVKENVAFEKGYETTAGLDVHKRAADNYKLFNTIINNANCNQLQTSS